MSYYNEEKLNYQLGVMTAEFYIATQLPTLSTDLLQTNKVIKVSDELSEIWKKKGDYWMSLINSKNINDGNNVVFYENLNWYKENIEKVYLRDVDEFYVPQINPTNIKKFGEGFEDALWDCDMSHYTYKTFIKKNNMGPTIILELNKDK